MYCAVLWDGTTGTYFHEWETIEGSAGCIHLLEGDDEDFYNSYQFKFGDTDNIAYYLRRGPEIFDVIVRCTALDDVYDDVIDYYEEVMAREGAKPDGN